MKSNILARFVKKGVSDSGEDRPIKTVKTGYNSWRIVYADEQPAPEN